MAHRLTADFGIELHPHPYGTKILNLLEFDRPFTSGSSCKDKTFSEYVLLSHVPCTLDGKAPETMAFICDKDGDVLDWNELCVSYARDAPTGFMECIYMLEAM